MKRTRFLTDAHMKGGTPVPDELNPLPLIITCIGMNRYTLESQALLRVKCDTKPIVRNQQVSCAASESRLYERCG